MDPAAFPNVEIPSRTVFRTPGFNPFAIKVSPFDGSLLAVAASQNFGLKGGGRIYIVQIDASGRGEGQLLRAFDFKDGIFDLAWSEVDRAVLVAGGGDGKVLRMNFESGAVEVVGGHSREISCVDWSPLRQDKFLTTSWDGSIKISTSIKAVATAGSNVVNEARWSPRQVNIFASVSADRTARIWDDRSLNACSAVITGPEVTDFMSLDWNKYDEWNLVTATPTDLLLWDLRALNRGPLYRIPGAHRRAIKRVRFSPWQGMKLASVGFDMSLRLWDLTALNPRGPHFDGYTEFTTGLDWSLFDRNKIFTCSWDETVRTHQLY